MTRGRTGQAREAGAGAAQRGIDYASFFPEENLLDTLLSSEDEESDHDNQGNVTPRTGQHVAGDAVATASPGMSVAGRVHGRMQLMKMQAAKPSSSHLSQDSSQPIAQRTRATRVAKQLPAPDIDLDDVLFDVDDDELEDIENFGKVFDDDEEYQKFLASLQHFEEQDRMGGGAAGDHAATGDGFAVGEAHGDAEDDDDDFIDELQDMIAEEVDQVFGGQRGLFQADRYLTSDMPIEKISFIFRKRGKGSLSNRKTLSKAPKQLRRSARVENQKRRYAGRLILKHNAGTHEPGRIKDAAALAALLDYTEIESVYMALKEKNRTQLPSKALNPDVIEETANAVVWKPPLPSTIRKAHEKLKMEAAANTSNPELRHRFQLSMFGTPERQKLVKQIKQHVQMCFQSLCLAAVQKMEDEVIEQLKRTLLSSMEGLFPVLQELHPENISTWEEGIHGLIQQVDSNQVGEVDWRLIGTKSAGRSPSTTARKKEPPLREIAGHIWSHLPYPLLRKVAKIRLCFDPIWEPRRSQLGRFTKQQLFTPAEDCLLAWGIRKHVYNWSKIREELLPHREENEIFRRKKHLVSDRAREANVVADAVKAIVMPLTNAEVQLLQQATWYYGINNKGHYLSWDIICRDHLPYREPKVLSMLWSEWRKAHHE